VRVCLCVRVCVYVEGGWGGDSACHMVFGTHSAKKILRGASIALILLCMDQKGAKEDIDRKTEGGRGVRGIEGETI